MTSCAEATARRSRPAAWLVPGLLGLALLGVTVPALGQTRAVPADRQQITLSFAPVAQSAAPAVVNIYAKQVVRQAVSPLFDDPFFQRFFGPNFPGAPLRERVQNSLGSGVIIRADGLIVTNHHVIENADEITVVLSDRSEYSAEVARSDQRTDLAVLRLKDLGTKQLPVLELADSDEVEVGDLVLAIGNPFGVGQTVTMGIVSALARTSVGISDYSFFIQTDAAINPGNSGGALVGMDGKLIGINSAIYSRSGGSLGIGFAIPANMVRVVVESVEHGTPLVRPWLGASGQLVTAEIAQSLGLPHPGGVLIKSIDADGPAARAGLRVGDIIIAFNGRPVDDPEALRYRLATQAIGGTARLAVIRGGAEQQLTLALEVPPEVPPRETTVLDGRHPLRGAVVANLSPGLIEEVGYSGTVRHGVIVLEVRQGAPAQRLGLAVGDVLLRVNGTEVTDVRMLERLLERGTRGGWRLAIRRGDQVLESVVYE